MTCNGELQLDNDDGQLIDLLPIDINECAKLNGNCSQICTNSNGSYACSCFSGFQINSNNQSCNGKDFNVI